ncbi:MAG: 4Fe-4S binding protein [Planctomycetes bacterium]|nr:4Fe-4S binding protein [Planctomycetota bacterium]
MPKAELAPRASDMSLPAEQLLKLGLFQGLSRPPSLEKYPGSLVLRHFQAGEVICRQAAPGWTAFYVLTSADVLEMLRYRLRIANSNRQRKKLVRDVARMFLRVRQLQDHAGDHVLREAAGVYLAAGPKERRPRPGWLNPLARLWAKPPDRKKRPASIPFDGPTVIQGDSRQAVLCEGDLFGEMSCLHFVPRSATVIARRELFLLEMLPNILEQLNRDAAFNRKMDPAHRSLLPLRQLGLFRNLAEPEMDELAQHAEFVSFEPGEIVLDEHEASDRLYIVWRGLVKVQKGVSALLAPEQVADWNRLLESLRGGAQPSSLPMHVVWRMLSASARRALEGTVVSAEGCRAILVSLNAILKMNPGLAANLAFQRALSAPPADGGCDHDVRVQNRRLLEGSAAGLHPFRPHPVGLQFPLCYWGHGELIGEIGLFEQDPNPVTCTAHGQRVELVSVPRALLVDWLPRSRWLGPTVTASARRRTLQITEQMRSWREPAVVLQGTRADELGLAQGRKLMLIDMDRCTRCGECVEACADNHVDGRSRLFLVGPRIGQYLVPSTCRACRDPQCLVGCPVGSIHQGDVGQIVIEDWCIGCGLCARQCPYGAIQMHDIGVIAEQSAGWRLNHEGAVRRRAWQQANFNDCGWTELSAPFHDDAVLRAALKIGDSTEAVCLRHAFHLSDENDLARRHFRLEAHTKGRGLAIWINGERLPAAPSKAGKQEFWIPRPREVGSEDRRIESPTPLRAGRNVLAVRVRPGPVAGELLLQLTLHEVSKPELKSPEGDGVAEVAVTHRAVTCDLCGPRGPACVRACPHDAAFRIDGLIDLPVRLKSNP